MARWDTLQSRGNVEDRRGSIPMIGGGLSLTGLAIVFLFTYLSGGDIGDVLGQLQGVQTPAVQPFNSQDFAGEDSYEVFASKVLGSTNDLWASAFASAGARYQEPTLVLFRGGTPSSCGGADAASGPHYCPSDQTIYLDETFFEELTKRLGAEGGDVAEAYVIAHEVGHHVQNQLGLLESSANNGESIATELQADCFAGLWAYSIKDLGVFEEGEIREAMDAAAAVGDDRIQAKTTGRVHPESWTHGSSADRVAAFTKGYESGSVAACTQ